MKIYSISQNQNNNYNNKNQSKQSNQANPSFKGISPIEFLRFLDTNQAWGANFVDLGFMVTPRTITDFGRGPQAGVETLRREGFGTANHSAVGPLYGTLAGMLLAMGLNKTYGLNKMGSVKASSIYADSETLDNLGSIFDKNLKSSAKKEDLFKNFFNDALKSYEVLDPNKNGEWIKIGDNEISNVARILEEQVNSPNSKMSAKKMNQAKNIIISAVGAENNFRIASNSGKEHTSRYTVDYILENLYKLGKTFNNERVKDAFKGSLNENKFISAMKSMNRNRSIIGVGIAALVGISAQPLNMYLTRLKTGSNDFVGGGKEDKSTKFKITKSLTALAFLTGALATIGNPLDLIKNIQFKGMSPTIKQFKFIYGITIASRIFSARNTNELKETTTKDTLGFINWLILGNFVQKLVAQGLTKLYAKNNSEIAKFNLIKKSDKKTGVLNWIQNSILKSRDEVLITALKKEGKDVSNMTFKEMYKELPKNHVARKLLGILTVSQLAGYLYSGLVLGIGIPKLNIYLTKRREAEKALKEQESLNAKNQSMPKLRMDPEVKKQFTGVLNK